SSTEPLKVVLGAEATSLEPAFDTVKSSIVVTNTMLETLAINTPDQKFAPWLAESWQNVEPTKWRLKLKQGVKFHNGEPFNADSGGKKPAIGDIQFRWAGDASARVALLQTGEVHLAQNIPPALVDRVEQSGSARIEQVKSIRKVFLQMNINDGPFQDVRVRRA